MNRDFPVLLGGTDATQQIGETGTMILTIAVLVAAGALMLHKARVSERVNTADPGSMSAQWLAEHRASHPS